MKAPIVREISKEPPAQATSPRQLVPDMLAWVMKLPEKRATMRACYDKFRPVFVYPISFSKFRKTLESVSFGKRLAEIRSKSSPDIVKRSAKAMVDSFVEERNRRGINHLSKMYKSLDKIHDVFDSITPNPKSLHGYVKQAQDIHTLGRSVFNLDKEDENISSNQINVAVLIGRKEDDADIINV